MCAPRFAIATFGLRLALRLFEKTNNDVATTSTVSNPLLHVRPPRAGGIEKASTYYSCPGVHDRWAQQVVGPPVMQPKAGAVKAPSSVREGQGIVVIKFLGLVRVDTTHQSTALDKSLFTHFKWATSYVGVDIFCFICTPSIPKYKSF